MESRTDSSPVASSHPKQKDMDHQMNDRWLASLLIASQQNEDEGMEAEQILRHGISSTVNLSDFEEYLATLFSHLSRQNGSIQQAFVDEFPQTLRLLHPIFESLKTKLPTETLSALFENILTFLSLFETGGFPAQILASLSCLSYHCRSEHTLSLLLKLLETHIGIEPNGLDHLIKQITEGRLQLACDILSTTTPIPLPSLFNLVSQDIVLFDLLLKLRLPEALDSILDLNSLNDLVVGCCSLEKITSKEGKAVSRRAVQQELRAKITTPEDNDVLRLIMSGFLLARCFRLQETNENTKTIGLWWLSRLLTYMVALGDQDLDSDQVYLLGEMSAGLFEVLDTTPEALTEQGCLDFVDAVRSRHRNAASSRDFMAFASIWNFQDPEAPAQEEIAALRQPDGDDAMKEDSLLPVPGVLYDPDVSEEEQNQIAILKALIDPDGPTVGDGYLLIALRVACSIYEEQGMNGVIEQLAADPCQCEVFFPSDLLVVKRMTSLDIAVGILRNLQQIRTEKAPQKRMDYSDINKVGRSWEARNKTMQLVRKQQEEEQREDMESDPTLQDPSLKATPVDFLITSDSTAYSVRPWDPPPPSPVPVAPPPDLTQAQQPVLPPKAAAPKRGNSRMRGRRRRG